MVSGTLRIGVTIARQHPALGLLVAALVLAAAAAPARVVRLRQDGGRGRRHGHGLQDRGERGAGRPGHRDDALSVSFVRPRSGAPSLSDVSQEEVLAPNGMSPLLNLPSMDADRERIEEAMHAAVVTPDVYLNEIASHLIVAGGKRLRPVLAVAGAQIFGTAASARRRAWRRRVRTRPPRFALPRRRDGRGRHPSRRRDRQRASGATCRRSSPATSCCRGRRRSPRRSAPRSPGCWRARSAGSARARSRSSATPTTRSRTEEQLPARRSTARPRRCTAPRRGSAASSPASTVPVIDALTEYGNAYGIVFQIVDDIFDITATDDQLGKPAGHDMVEGVYTLAGVAHAVARQRCGVGAGRTARLAARRRRAGQGARDRSLERRARVGRRHRPRVRRARRGSAATTSPTPRPPTALRAAPRALLDSVSVTA